MHLSEFVGGFQGGLIRLKLICCAIIGVITNGIKAIVDTVLTTDHEKRQDRKNVFLYMVLVIVFGFGVVMYDLVSRCLTNYYQKQALLRIYGPKFGIDIQHPLAFISLWLLSKLTNIEYMGNECVEGPRSGLLLWLKMISCAMAGLVVDIWSTIKPPVIKRNVPKKEDIQSAILYVTLVIVFGIGLMAFDYFSRYLYDYYIQQASIAEYSDPN